MISGCFFFIILGFSQARGLANEASPDVSQVFLALKNQSNIRSIELRAAKHSLDQKRAQSYTSIARWLPRFDLQAVQARTKDYSAHWAGLTGPFGKALAEPEYENQSRWSLVASMPLYKRSVHINGLVSRAELRLAEAQLNAQLFELDWKLRQLFGSYLLESYRISSIQSAIDTAKTNLRDSKTRFELGQRTKVDVLKSESNLFLLDSRLQTAEQSRNSALNALLEYTGMSFELFKETGIEGVIHSEDSLQKAITQLTETESGIQAVKPFLGQEEIVYSSVSSIPESHRTEIESRIMEYHPAYRQALEQSDLSERQAENLMAAEWPELLLQASITKQSDSWKEATDADHRNQSAQITLNIPIFSWGSTVSTYLEKINVQNLAQIRKEREMMRIRNQVFEDLIQVRSLLRNLESLKLNVEKSTEIQSLTQKSFQLGKASMLELLAAQNDLNESKLIYAQTQIQTSVLTRRLAWGIGAVVP